MPHPPRTPALWPALLFWMLLCLTGCSSWLRQDEGEAAQAAGQDAFTLDVQAPDTVRETLERHLELQRFRQLPDLQAHELQRLLGNTEANARELLGTLGYFAPRIELELRPPPDGARTPPFVRLSVDPGPATRIASATIALEHRPGDSALDSPDALPEARTRLQERLQAQWALPPGQVFTQSAWDNAKSAGLRQLQVQRYPTAHIANSLADVDADSQQAALSVSYDTGPAYRFGPLQVQGSQRYDPDAARRLARLPTGAVYDESALLDAQLRLAQSGYYDAVFLALDTEAPDPGNAPVVAQVREARLQKWVFGAGLSTDSGARLSLEHTHNQLPALGWRALSQLSLDAKAQRLGTEWTDLPGEDGWRSFASAQLLREATGPLDIRSARLRAGQNQGTQRIDRTVFVQYDHADSQGLNAPPTTTALSLNYGWTGRYFDHPNAPTRGHGLALELGGGSTLRPAHTPFVRTRVRWQSFIPTEGLAEDRSAARSPRLALRTEAGAVIARASAELPVGQLFLTGGDTTVRGYGYRSIGTQTRNQQLYGGRYLAVASLEWQQPLVHQGVLTDWESALFLDAGAVGDQLGALEPRVGVGAGVRWRSPVGPLQADLAYGVQSQSLRLHLRLGFSF
ncbi:MAG: BamA/TamA family outer membrane protein [Burkholderiaceae bacterium]|nr:BamA/TamA family outer membrane protein [Burkholderiaceae bacterium]